MPLYPLDWGWHTDPDPSKADTTLGRDPNLIRVADPGSPAGPAQRTAVIRNLPGVGEAYLDSDFASKIDDFARHARNQGVDLQFTSAYRSPEYREYMISHPKETGTVYPPAKDSLHMAGLAVDVRYEDQDDATRKIIRDSATKAGLSWGGNFAQPDTVHSYFDPTPGTDRRQLIRNFGDQVRTLFVSRMKEPL